LTLQHKESFGNLRRWNSDFNERLFWLAWNDRT